MNDEKSKIEEIVIDYFNFGSTFVLIKNKLYVLPFWSKELTNNCSVFEFRPGEIISSNYNFSKYKKEDVVILPRDIGIIAQYVKS